MSTYESFAELSGELRQDLSDWLLAVADNKRVLGLRYAEWCTGAPELEANVAISAMAQYELGHARLLRGVLADLPEDPHSSKRSSDPAAWRSLAALDRPARGWPEVIVLNALVDGLLTVNLQAAAGGGVAPLAQRLRKAVSEETYHTLHAEAWFERLLGGPEHIVGRVEDAVRAVFPQCIAWFGPAGANALDRLAAAGVVAAGAAELRQSFLDAVGPMLDPCPGIVRAGEGDAGLVGAPVDWEGWSETSRRHGVPDFDADSFALLTGAYARAIGVQE